MKSRLSSRRRHYSWQNSLWLKVKQISWLINSVSISWITLYVAAKSHSSVEAWFQTPPRPGCPTCRTGPVGLAVFHPVISSCLRSLTRLHSSAKTDVTLKLQCIDRSWHVASCTQRQVASGHCRPQLTTTPIHIHTLTTKEKAILK